MGCRPLQYFPRFADVCMHADADGLHAWDAIYSVYASNTGMTALNKMIFMGVTPMAPLSSPFLTFLYSVQPGFCGRNRFVLPESSHRKAEILISQAWKKSVLADARKFGKQSGLPKKELRLLTKLLTKLSL